MKDSLEDVPLKNFVSVVATRKDIQKIEKITKNLQMKHIKLVNKSMLELALGIAAMSTLYIPVIIGSPI